MKLSDWLAKNDMNPAEFGRRLGLKYPRNVYRYVNGRVPPIQVMRGIAEVTCNEVRADDWVHAD